MISIFFYIVAIILLVLSSLSVIVAPPKGITRQWGQIIIFAIVGMLALVVAASAHDSGQWEETSPEIRQWYKGLMQPDAPTASCCGEADAYWCDTINVRDKTTYCTITDDREDAPLGRPHIDVGTEIEIPNEKLKWDRGNPTGHAIVFVSRGGYGSKRYIYCFVQSSGI